VIFLHVCPQCESQYCNPFACRFSGLLNEAAGSLPADVRGGKPSGVSHKEQTAMRGLPNTRSTPTNSLEAA
jgi:hypothetical protein